jgi:type II secretory pathway component PulF
MAFFSWSGIAHDGRVKYGTIDALSKEHVQQILEKQQIRILAARRTLLSSVLSPPKASSLFYYYCSSLLSSGIRLPDAFIIMSTLPGFKRSKNVFMQCSTSLQEGMSLHEVACLHSSYFDRLARIMFEIGEAGSMKDIFERLAAYYQARVLLRQQVIATLAMPLVTLSFFLVLVCVMFIMVIPRFEVIMHSMKYAPQGISAVVFSMSHALQNGWYYFLSLSVFSGFIFWYFNRLVALRDKFLVSIPGIGSLLRAYNMVIFLHAYELYLAAGIYGSKAVYEASILVPNYYMQIHLKLVAHDVSNGDSIADAFSKRMPQETMISAFINVGDQSGNLTELIHYAATMYAKMVMARMQRVVYFAQPCIVIILGVLIATTMIALYMPLLELSTAVSL